MPDQPTTISEELAAMRRIVTALQPLDPRAQARVIGWLVDRYEPDDLDEPRLVRLVQEGE